MNALEVAQRSIDAWNRHDADALVALYAEGGAGRAHRNLSHASKSNVDPCAGNHRSGPFHDYFPKWSVIVPPDLTFVGKRVLAEPHPQPISTSTERPEHNVCK
jgi:hypothetical protein